MCIHKIMNYMNLDTFSREFKELNNKTEIGVKPASGLRPPKLKADEINDKPVCKSSICLCESEFLLFFPTR